MIITSTNDLKGYKITQYLGLVNVNVVLGANFFSDLFASFTDVFGGYSGAYQSKLDKIYGDALRELTKKAEDKRADALVGVSFDFDEISGKGVSMFMVTAYGTAVKAEPIAKEIVKTERYEVYQRLYNLSKFKESGIINDEQYEAERKNLLLLFEDDINKEIENIKSENANREVVKQAKLEYKQLKEKERLEIEKAKEEKRKEELAIISEKEKQALIRKEKEQDIKNAVETFKSNAPMILVKVRGLLENNIKNPKEALDKITQTDIASANYNDMGINPSDNAAHSIGLFLKKERYADACKYYIDLVNDDDIGEAKNYINSIYDMLSFKNQAAFVAMAKNLVELKVLGKIDEAVDEFASYALCSKDIARLVIDMI
jgi:uncharacterized protein YbjQ (UPF0145 family)